MKTKILSTLLGAAALIGLGACSDDNWSPAGDDNAKGQVSLASVDLAVDDLDPIVIDSRADASLDNFLIDVYNEQGVKQDGWKYGQMPEVITLPVGTYTVKARSHEIDKAAWEAPYYEGEAQFEVFENKITDVGTVLCSFASIKVTVEYTADLYKLLGDDVQVEVVCNDEGQLIYSRDEKRAGYFEAVDGSSTLAATLTGTINGATVSMYKVFTDIKACQHRKIVFSARKPSPIIPDEYGNITIGPDGQGIIIDATLVNVDINGNVTDEDATLDPSDRPGQEEGGQGGGEEPGPDPVDPPTPPTPGDDPITFTSPLSFTEANPVTEDMSNAMVTIHADEGIESFVVAIYTTDANFSASVSGMLEPTIDTKPFDSDPQFATCFDLTTIPASLDYIYVESLNFPVRGDVKGKTDLVFNIKDLAPLLGAFTGTHSFRLIVTDPSGNSLDKTLVFVAK